MNLNDHVRILDTDPRPYLHGLTGRLTRSAANTEFRINLDEGQSIESFPGDLEAPLAGWWVSAGDFELIPEASPASNDPDAPMATLPATTQPAATFKAPGFYTVGVDADGRLRVDSFTSAVSLDEVPDSPAGLWVVSRGNEDGSTTVLSIHDDELDAWRHTANRTAATVTFVEYGAPVQDVVRETNSL
jgi:hypothetical protein